MGVVAKGKIEAADKKAAGAKKEAETNTKIEKKDLADAAKRQEKESKFDHTHLEKNEKNLELSKQRVAKWISEVEENEKKLAKMRTWEKEKKTGAAEAVGAEAKSKKD